MVLGGGGATDWTVVCARVSVMGRRVGGASAGSILGNQIVVHGGAVSESLTINPRGVGPLNNKHGDRGVARR